MKKLTKIRKNNFLSFKKALFFARSLNLKSCREWRMYCVEQKPEDIPYSPDIFYRNNGWISWGNWLGTNNIRGGLRKYRVNDDYFKKWSSNMSYILGLWWSDGCIMKNTNSKKTSYIFNMCQHKKDKYILMKILNEMGSNYPLRLNKNACEFNINSEKVFNDVVKLGGEERKSLICKFPDIPKKYLPDFIRGLWDGDGCVYYNKTRKCYLSSYVSGSKIFIYKLQKVIIENVDGIGGSIYEGMRLPNKTYLLSFGRNDTVKFRDFIYGNCNASSLKLVRKENTFLKVTPSVSRQYLNFDDAKRFVKKLNLKNKREWEKYSKNVRSSDMPSHPEETYKRFGWMGWRDWLGTKDIKEWKNKIINFS